MEDLLKEYVQLKTKIDAHKMRQEEIKKEITKRRRKTEVFGDYYYEFRDSAKMFDVTLFKEQNTDLYNKYKTKERKPALYIKLTKEGMAKLVG